MHRSHRIFAAAVLGALLPLAAQAHPGHETYAGFAQGVQHLFTGWDHLTVLLCLGLLAGGRGLNLALTAGLLLASSLLAGATLGLVFPDATFVEPVILATVLASAVLLLRARISRGVLLALCLAFTLVHGMAHGQEAPTGAIGVYFAGFTLAALMIYSAGALLAAGMRRLRARSSRHPVRA